MTKKEKEKYTLECFTEVFDDDIEILSCSQAQKVFSNYNGENPDFVILYKNNNIGVELFELTKEFSRGVYKSTGNKNFPHLICKKKNDFETSGLIEVDDLGSILHELIEKKLKKN